MKNTSVRPRAGDFAVAAAVVLIAAAVWLVPLLSGGGQGGKVAVVRCDGAEVLRVALDRDEEERFDVPGGVVEVRDGGVRMLRADCPDQVCVKTGWIEREGQSIVCAPGRIVIEVQGGAGQDGLAPDMVAE